MRFTCRLKRVVPALLAYLAVSSGVLYLFFWSELEEIRKGSRWLRSVSMKRRNADHRRIVFPEIPQALPPSDRRISSVSCSFSSRTCFVQNLYFFNGEFHAYVGEKAKVDEIRNFKAYTGIGFGTSFVEVKVVDSSKDVNIVNASGKSTGASSAGNLTAQVASASNSLPRHSGMTIPLYVHPKMPPEADQLPPDLGHHFEPVAFFSVLWKNLFRTIYAGIGSWLTMIEYKVFFPDHHRLTLIDKNPKPSDFVHTLEAVSPYPVRWLEDLSPGLYKAAVFGISRNVLVAELDLELKSEGRFEKRALAFRAFCDKLKNNLLQKKALKEYKSSQLPQAGRSQRSSTRPRVTLVLRTGKTRRVLNEKDIIAALKTLPIDLAVHQFDGLALEEQLAIIDETDVLVSMHGAALTHLLFLRPETYLVELFPYAFRKIIYQNLAKIMKVKYACWQNTKEIDTVFNWASVEANRYTDVSKGFITRQFIDWRNMDSKNYWRNQDTYVDSTEFGHVISSVLADMKGPAHNKFLIYQPWEQFNNQVLGLKSACATAKILNRTLVLPRVGYRYEVLDDIEEYPVAGYMWKPFERYFDLASALRYPCSTITFDNFLSLRAGRSIGTLRYHHLGNQTSQKQFIAYYKQEVRIPFDTVVWDKVYYQLSKRDILRVHGGDSSEVLALGTMFWYHDFGMKQTYPLDHFYNFMKDPIYRGITAALDVHQRYIRMADYLMETRIRNGTHRFVASIHWRRGDYFQKCEGVKRDWEQKLGREVQWTDREVQRCWQNPSTIINALNKLVPNVKKRDVIFVATNSNSWQDWNELVKLATRAGWKTVVSQQQLVPWSGGNKNVSTLEIMLDEKRRARKVVPKEWRIGLDEVQSQMDPIDLLILDQQLCMKADIFVGNLYSSASRRIIEGRILAGKSWNVF
ncbi:hypothetical protein BJ742DRAFT_563295 [Cladochytrium replicatum]|nr:hypothetical protein BJ742DRAFT_563295 [Cladochytrium replicatum]